MKKLLAALLLLPSLCFARPQVEVGVGYTIMNHHGDGTWWQQPFEHKLEMTSTSFSLGLTEYIIPNLRYRFGFEYLGSAKSTAKATASDADYEDGPPYWPLSNWYGKGNVKGLYASVVPEWKSDFLTYYAEAGIYIYKPTWTMTIPDWRPCELCDPRFLEVKHNAKPQITPMFGGGVRYGNTSVGVLLRKTEAKGDDWPAIYKGNSYNLYIRQSF